MSYIASIRERKLILTDEPIHRVLVRTRNVTGDITKKSKSEVTLVSLIEDITNEISLKYTLENYFIINKQKKKEFEEKSRKKLLRPTRIRSYIIKAIKTNSISLVCLYSGSKLNKLGGYLYSSVLYISKEKEIYIINKDLFIIKETSGAGMKFIELKTSRTRLYVLYEKGRLIRKVNKVSVYARPARLIDKIYIDIVYLKPKGLNSHSYASIFLYAYSTGKILLEESTPYTLE
ncbi:uncharacterized protein RAG0_09573 [Rhynchosporium agropyri]|uniref:Uncharacterized protein n=1 Tax=Rhynchosporium agropyri TaxID=914238 RepID=A0A1E1KW09_9HELO|nr:uncharacterized protein RAG0_09573 [Rhynchosporium agropyri]